MDPPQLPPELVEHILGIAAYNGTWDEKQCLMSLSKSTYNSVFCTVFRIIQLPVRRHLGRISDMEQLLAFSIWVESKPAILLHAAVHALRIVLSTPGQDPEIWRRLFQKLTGLMMLEVFCSQWLESPQCLPVVWDSIFRLPDLKRLNLDWHMNPLALPSPNDSPLYALRHLTHLTIVPHGHSIHLDFLQRFEALTYLIIFNPGLGYTRDHIVSFEEGLPRLSILLLVFTTRRGERPWVFEQSQKIAALNRVTYSWNDEYGKELNGGNSIWKIGEEALAKRLRI
ncbi:hypothetical protein DL96DRAFT_1626192 [Flagelloscypha sp. PMI_526]|nr:hypothetical protein DL96DRAFT_1626192 [Flagelloscypha sp. PMI_526]